jgi:hypothetical protein
MMRYDGKGVAGDEVAGVDGAGNFESINTEGVR